MPLSFSETASSYLKQFLDTAGVPNCVHLVVEQNQLGQRGGFRSPSTIVLYEQNIEDHDVLRFVVAHEATHFIQKLMIDTDFQCEKTTSLTQFNQNLLYNGYYAFDQKQLDCFKNFLMQYGFSDRLWFLQMKFDHQCYVPMDKARKHPEAYFLNATEFMADSIAIRYSLECCKTEQHICSFPANRVMVGKVIDYQLWAEEKEKTDIIDVQIKESVPFGKRSKHKELASSIDWSNFSQRILAATELLDDLLRQDHINALRVTLNNTLRSENQIGSNAKENDHEVFSNRSEQETENGETTACYRCAETQVDER